MRPASYWARTTSPSDRLEDLHLLVADGLRVEGDGGLHGREGDQLHRVVLDHVPESPALVVVAGPRAHPDVLRHGNLDGIHVLAVPEWLEDGVGETLHEQVLDGLLAEVVIDPEDLGLPEVAGDHPVEFLRAGPVVPEGFLDDDLAGLAAALVVGGETGAPEVVEDGSEDPRRGGDVEEVLQLPADLVLDRGETLGEGPEVGFVLVGARLVEGPIPQRGPDLFLQGAARVLADGPGRPPAEFLLVHLAPAVADKEEVRRQEVVDREVVKGREELARGQVPGRAEDDEHGRRGAPVLAEPPQEGMSFRRVHG